MNEFGQSAAGLVRSRFIVEATAEEGRFQDEAFHVYSSKGTTFLKYQSTKKP